MKKKAASKSGDDALLFSIIEGIEEVKGSDIKILDLRSIGSAMSDYFVICTGSSTTQVEAIARSTEEFTRKNLNERPRRVEGVRNAQWVLMDYFSVVVHIFEESMRDHYDIEGLWADGTIVALPKKPKPRAKPKTKEIEIDE